MERLWEQLGEEGKAGDQLWDTAHDIESELRWNDANPKPLFQRLDLDEILKNEGGVAESQQEEVNYIEFEDFLKVEMKTGRIL